MGVTILRFIIISNFYRIIVIPRIFLIWLIFWDVYVFPRISSFPVCCFWVGVCLGVIGTFQKPVRQRWYCSSVSAKNQKVVTNGMPMWWRWFSHLLPSRCWSVPSPKSWSISVLLKKNDMNARHWLRPWYFCFFLIFFIIFLYFLIIFSVQKPFKMILIYFLCCVFFRLLPKTSGGAGGLGSIAQAEFLPVPLRAGDVPSQLGKRRRPGSYTRYDFPTGGKLINALS